jgi:hypothetical protein
MKKKLLLIFATLFFAIGIARSQSDIMYFMNETPQSSFLNPAFGVKLGNYISVPVLSGIQVDFHTSGFSYHDIIHKRPANDSLIIDLEGFHNTLRTSNNLNLNSKMSIFGLGFTFGKTHLSFDLSLGINSRFGLEKSLFGFILYGTENTDEGLVYDEPLVDMNVYLSPSVSFAREIGDKLIIGTRVGLLLGVLDITTNETKISLTQGNTSGLTLQSNIDVMTSNIFARLRSSALFSKDSTTWTISNGTNVVSEAIKNLFQNKGGVIDIGTAYKINEDMQISAAITDLGFIRWQSNTTAVRSRHPNASVEFQGINDTLQELEVAINDYVDMLGDTLSYIFDMEAVDIASYTSMLPTKIFLGYTWHFAPVSYLHALYKGVAGSGYFDQYFSVFYGLHWKMLAFSAGNTFSSGRYFNPSFAFSLTGAGVNLYAGGSFSSKTTTINVADMSGANLFLGLNLLIDRKKYWDAKIIPL